MRKLQHWGGFQAENARKGAPMLEFAEKSECCLLIFWRQRNETIAHHLTFATVRGTALAIECWKSAEQESIRTKIAGR